MKARPVGGTRAIDLTAINWLRLLATAMFGGIIVAIAVAIYLWAGQRFRPPPVSFIQGSTVFIAEFFYAISYGAMGWLLATRLPRNVLGWIFLTLAALMAAQLMVTFLIQEGHQAFRPLSSPMLFSAWLASSANLPAIVVLTAVVFLRFPTGKPLTPRWRAAGWLTFIGALLVVLGVGLEPAGLAWYPTLTNIFAAPFSWRPMLGWVTTGGMVLMASGAFLATASMILRYRRAGSVERAQLRWIAVAVMAITLAGIPFVVVRYGMQAGYSTGGLLLATALIAGCFLPVAAAVAILRHRLYDIDLILNRALVYIPLTAILGGLYTAGVALSQRLFVTITGDRSDAAIVITTLVMAGLFTPIRNWLQGFVDRRFKPAPAATGGPVEDETLTVDQRLALLEQRLARMEVREPRGDWS
jgi:hypothetical protein